MPIARPQGRSISRGILRVCLVRTRISCSNIRFRVPIINALPISTPQLSPHPHIPPPPGALPPHNSKYPRTRPPPTIPPTIPIYIIMYIVLQSSPSKLLLADCVDARRPCGCPPHWQNSLSNRAIAKIVSKYQRKGLPPLTPSKSPTRSLQIPFQYLHPQPIYPNPTQHPPQYTTQQTPPPPPTQTPPPPPSPTPPPPTPPPPHPPHPHHHHPPTTPLKTSTPQTTSHLQNLITN
jgi:hypothetical protein